MLKKLFRAVGFAGLANVSFALADSASIVGHNYIQLLLLLSVLPLTVLTELDHTQRAKQKARLRFKRRLNRRKNN